MSSTPKHDWVLSVIESHERLIRMVCWSYANSRADQEDLFQEIACRLLTAAGNYDPTRKLSTWLYRVALNVAIDFHRKQKGRKERYIGDNIEPASEQDQVFAEQLQELRELLEYQSEADRALLLLYLEGHSHAEIGEVLGISESNVGTRLHRLKESLRQFVVAGHQSQRGEQ